MQPMTPDEYQAFIRQGSKTGKLASVRKDGRPHCVPVWCGFEDDCIVFMTMSTSVKAQNIRRDPRVAITFDNESFPYDFVTVEGTAEILEVSRERLLEISTSIASRYVPAGRAEEFGERNAVSDEQVVKVTPTKVISAKGVAN